MSCIRHCASGEKRSTSCYLAEYPDFPTTELKPGGRYHTVTVSFSAR